MSTRYCRMVMLVSLVAFVLAAGCYRKEQEAKVTASSTENAHEPLVDEDYRFRISWPGDGWKLVREADMRRVSPDAIAGALSSKELWGSVIVEHAPGVALDAISKLILDSMALEDRNIEKDEDITFVGQQARRVVLTGRINDAPFRYVLVMFKHQDYLYQLIGWGQQSTLTAGGTELQPFFNAFSLLDGQVKGRTTAESVVSAASGPGWRLQQGVFVSAVSRLRVKAPAGWRVAIGSELQRMNADAEVGLISGSPELYIIVIAEPASVVDEEAFLRMTREGVASTLGGSIEEPPVELRFAGEMRKFHRLRGTNPPLEFFYTVMPRGGIAYQVMAWRIAGAERLQDLSRVGEGLAAIELLDQQQTAEVRRELEAEPDRQNAVGEGFSLRRGLYRDFAGKWTWRKPGGFWRILAGQAARAENADASLFAQEPSMGLYVMAISEQVADMDLATYTAAVRNGMDDQSRMTEPKRMKLGDVQAQVWERDMTGGPIPLRFRIATAVHGGTAMQILVWGDVAQMKAQPKEIAAAMDAFRFAPDLQAVEQSGRIYRDWRMGFTFDPGSDEWSREDLTPANMGGVVTAISWRKGSRMMLVRALYNADERDREWFFDFLEQRVREALGKLASNEPTRQDVTVAGEPARRLVWKSLFNRVDAYLVSRDQVHYMVVGVGLDSDEGDALAGRFGLLE